MKCERLYGMVRMVDNKGLIVLVVTKVLHLLQ